MVCYPQLLMMENLNCISRQTERSPYGVLLNKKTVPYLIVVVSRLNNKNCFNKVKCIIKLT